MTKPASDFARMPRPSRGASLIGRNDWSISPSTRSTWLVIRRFRLSQRQMGGAQATSGLVFHTVVVQVWQRENSCVKPRDPLQGVLDRSGFFAFLFDV